MIPCYNLAASLPETLESVRRQTRTDWEAIVINDGSSDNTRDVVRDFLGRHRDPRFRYLEQPNRGLPAARNAGSERARGRYIHGEFVTRCLSSHEAPPARCEQCRQAARR